MATAHRCAICNQPALPGKRLCDPCKAALKRARDATFSEAILPPRRGRRRPPRAADPAPGAKPVAAEDIRRPVKPPHRTGLMMGAVAFAAVIATVAWVAHVRGAGGTLAPRYAVSDGAAETETARPLAARAPDRPVESVAPAIEPAAPVEEPGRTTGEQRAPPPRVSAVRLASAALATEPDPSRPPVPGPENLAVPEPAIVPPVPSPPAREASPPQPDRWLSLGTALAECPANDLIARTVCRQSLLIEHCTGWWGRAALCPAPVERDHGN